MDAAKEMLSSTAITEWRESLTGSMIRFGILTAIFIGILVAFMVTGNIQFVISDWSRYRCSPFIMPFAQFFGYDPAQNFQFCVKTLMQQESGTFFQPIYALLGQYGSSLGGVVDTINSFRSALGTFRLSTSNFVGGVMAKIQSLIFQIRITFMRMQTLMGRVYGTMYSIIWMGTSAITAGTSLADNSLVNFMFEFCFHPETKVRLITGELREIQQIRVGDVLDGGTRVTSTLRFDGTRTPMVQIGPDILSAEHRVMWEGEWIPAHQHPAAIPTSSLPLLICLNVTGHAFQTAAGLCVADYDESSDPTTTQDAQQIAEVHLNGGIAGVPSADYSLGIDPEAELWMQDSSWKRIHSLQIGDMIYGGAILQGLVEEECRDVRNYGGVAVSAAQLVYVDGLWRRAETLPMVAAEEAGVLIHCITDRGSPLFVRNPAQKAPIVVRDYREVAIPDMEEPYLAALAAVAEN